MEESWKWQTCDLSLKDRGLTQWEGLEDHGEHWRAVLEMVLSSLDLVLAPPTHGVRASRGPMERLAGEAVSRLELVEAEGEAFVGTRHLGGPASASL